MEILHPLFKNTVYDFDHINDLDHNGRTILFYFVNNFYIVDPPRVKTLINQGINVDIQDNDKQTALMWAYNNVEITKMLIDAGANVNLQNKWGETALIIAVKNNNIKVVEQLLAAETNVLLKDIYNHTAITYSWNDWMTYKLCLNIDPRPYIFQNECNNKDSYLSYLPRDIRSIVESMYRFYTKPLKKKTYTYVGLFRYARPPNESIQDMCVEMLQDGVMRNGYYKEYKVLGKELLVKSIADTFISHIEINPVEQNTNVVIDIGTIQFTLREGLNTLEKIPILLPTPFCPDSLIIIKVSSVGCTIKIYYNKFTHPILTNHPIGWSVQTTNGFIRLVCIGGRIGLRPY